MRRAFLCGADPLTRRSYAHRLCSLVEAAWRVFDRAAVHRRDSRLEDRIPLLGAQFAVPIQVCAVMSNHVHLVIVTDPELPLTWTDA